jgi:hypothetical protein
MRGALAARVAQTLSAIFAPGGNNQEELGAKDQYADYAEEFGCEYHALNLIAPWHKRSGPSFGPGP